MLSNQVSRISIHYPCQRHPNSFPFIGRKDSTFGTLSACCGCWWQPRSLLTRSWLQVSWAHWAEKRAYACDICLQMLQHQAPVTCIRVSNGQVAELILVCKCCASEENETQSRCKTRRRCCSRMRKRFRAQMQFEKSLFILLLSPIAGMQKHNTQVTSWVY